jgi:hypothetical protein
LESDLLESYQLTRQKELGVQMNIHKGLLIVVTSSSEESSPEDWIVLPPQSQRAAVLCRDAIQLMRCERRDQLGDTRHHTERQARDAPVPLYRVPGEDEQLAQVITPVRFFAASSPRAAARCSGVSSNTVMVGGKFCERRFRTSVRFSPAAARV